MTAGSLLRISARRVGAGAAMLAFAATAAPSTVTAFSTDAAATAQLAAEAATTAAGPVSTAATGARCIGPAFDDTPAFQTAIDTGHTVYAPALGGQCHITHALVMKTPGQIFHGDGRARTKIVIEPGFAGEGVFVAKTGEPGPVWRDFSISFVQRDTSYIAELSVYPPAFNVKDTPRFEMFGLGCYFATICIDMKGNSGGATIEGLQFSAFNIGILIDGSLDTLRILNPHWFPFRMTKKQIEIFVVGKGSRAVAIDAQRVDDLVICGGLFLGGLGLRISSSKNGIGFVSISNTDFDTTSGIELDAGTVLISTSHFNVGVSDAQAIKQDGGNLAITSTSFLLGIASQKPLIELEGGWTTISTSLFGTGIFDITDLKQGAGNELTLVANHFSKQGNTEFRLPIVEAGNNSRIAALANIVDDKGGKAGVFLSLQSRDPFNQFVGNITPGWQASTSK